MKTFKATSADQVIDLAKKHLSRGYFARTSIYSYEYFGRTYYVATVDGSNDLLHFYVSKKTAEILENKYGFNSTPFVRIF